ncbi:hypothetical protein [Pseudomonas sp. SO81]|uniref:hypothetical protein n=1 Tax=Pseudomonas sp. SO81 TaxID=2983246 RepID=UPI0025A3725B|nr:hypothetical protein [Pseudomonas sp. SO81]WJN59033.1 hypothetical protein OH686_09830 [Pseudomonas sp. SO81]
MALNGIRQQIHAKYGDVPSVTLSSDKPTGQAPMELFVTDEHTRHYLTLQTNADKDRGMFTGLLAGISAPLGLLTIIWMAGAGRGDMVVMTLVMCAALFLIPFLLETLRPLPLPVLFNRRTQEVYFDNAGELFHCPWEGIQAMACEFQMVGPYTGGTRHASLEILVRRLGEPDNALLLSLGSPAGKTLEMQKGFWEYIRSYMNNGPWFDAHGNRSDSDEFVRSQLAANLRPSDFLGHWRKVIAEKKAATEGKNYLSGIDAMMLFGNLLFYPANLIQDFTYGIAQRRSRNRWPSIVLERLDENGPTTRLIDLEQARGIAV